MNSLRTIVGTIAFLILLLPGCAGRSASPVMVYQHGDEERSCDALERELEMIEGDMIDLLPETDKADKNTQPGIAGIFLVVPFFFIDISKSEQVEANALIKRYNHLVEIADNKDCSLNRTQIPDFEKTDY